MKAAEKTITWPHDIYDVFKRAGIRQVAYVPDHGHSHLIRACHADKEMRAVCLTTEEEGVAMLAGAWLGGQRGALLMQSSGVGNCINMLAMINECRFPLLMLVTMRGEHGEFNPWQVPMGQATPGVLSAMGVAVHVAREAGEVVPMVDAAARLAFGSYQAAAVLISQRVIGIKSFQEQSAR